jgi:hypothetical protein
MRPLALGQPANDNDLQWIMGALREIETASYELDPSTPGAVTPATENPLVDGAAAVGTSEKYAREDHVHPADTETATATANARIAASAVRYDAAQSLNATQKTQALNNIGAQPAGSYQPPLGYTPVNKAGDTITGSLLVNNVLSAGAVYSSTAGDINAVRTSAPTTGVIFLGNTGRYLYYDGSAYHLPGARLYTNGYNIVVSVRMAYAADRSYAGGLEEPYGGTVITGASRLGTFRHRYLQYQLNDGGWYTAGYV